jgi:small subunit ribosomal protein S1
MSDQEKPQPEQAPKRSLREFFKRQGPAPENPPAGKVPSLDREDMTYGGGKPGAFEANLEAELERELNEAMGGAGMQELFGEQPKRIKAAAPPPGPRKGRVMSVRGKDVFVDVGGRIQGVIAAQQFGDAPPKVGDVVEVHIEGYDPDGLLILNRQGSAVTADWSTVSVGMIVEARVLEQNKGGLAVDVNGIRGFMPISQIEMFRVEDLTPYIGQKLKCLVTEVDREDRNLLVSRRDLFEKERAENAEKLWAEIGEGQVREGIVRSVKPFGAFVDLGGADGLLPVGEMSWQRIKDPSEVVKPGQRVRVVVLRVDRDTRKMTVGLRQLTSSPWDEANSNYPPGSVVKGKVTRLMDFGAFVELEPGVEGLVHISELTPQRVNRVGDVVKVNQEVNVKVLNVDVSNRRMSLSIKQALKAPEPVAEEAAEDEASASPPKLRKFTTPLRGGVGSKLIDLPKPGGEA